MTASMGFDFALVDMEHTPASFETVTETTRAVDAADGDTATIARAPWNDPVAIKRILDAGVQGVMVPMVESAEEAEAFVEATRYPPEGIRGVAGARAADYGLSLGEYVAEANERIVTIAQVETEAGLANVEEIAAVDGLDALFVGPADLSTALGIFGEYDHPEFDAAVETILETAHAEDVPVSTLAASGDQIEDWVDRGFDFLMAGIDASYVMAGAGRAKATAEAAFEARED
jgi:2-keto-3-deoxy-L-rhamnonate aldolase RhmA